MTDREEHDHGGLVEQLHKLHHLVLSPEQLLEPIVERVDQTMREVLEEDPFQWNSDSVASSLPLLRVISGYFGSEVRGWDNVPRGEPVIFIGNHSGGMVTVDPVPLLLRWYEARGCETPIYALGHNVLFGMPQVGPSMRRLGVLPASPENAERAIQKGSSVIVFPGGDYEVFRSWRQRNQIRFGGRMGFVELAIRTGVRVVPMTIHGAHESTFVLSRGHDFAMRAGLDRLKLKTFPITWSIPFGVVPAFIPSFPLPSKLTVDLGEPLDWSDFGADAANDPDVLRACYDEITSRMQSTLHRMATEHPYPILTRIGELNPLRVVRRWFGR